MSMRANQADQGLIQYEAGQDFVAMQDMTALSGNKIFSVDDAPWSGAPGKEPVIIPDGMATGGAITPTVTNDRVAVAAATLYQGGLLKSPLANLTVDVTRTAAYCTHSVTAWNDSGTWKFKATAGDNDASGYSTTHGEDGGPPLIPVGEIEVGWVRTHGNTPAVLTPSDIIQIPGASQERYDYPLFTEDYGTGSVEFINALPANHFGAVPKAVYCEVYTPTFAPLEPASDFTPPETTHSQSSTAVYGGAIGASSSSLGQGSFSAYLKDGVTDALLALKNQKLWFKFFPHRLRAPHILAQGILGISRSFPADNAIVAECTITADGAAIEVAA